MTAFGTDANNLEVASRAASHAVGKAADRHPAKWVSGAVPSEIWLDITK